MKPRVVWTERAPRQGWTIRYTPLGGQSVHLRSTPAFEALGPEARVRIERSTSQSMVATNFAVHEASEDVAFFAEVLRKILQRGSTPNVPSCEAPAGLNLGEIGEQDLIDALAGPHNGRPWELDTSFELHPTYEKPFWSLVRKEFPYLLRFMHPQAPFEAMTATSAAERWVDFLLATPWSEQPVAIELDGRQHEAAGAVDYARDELLRDAGVVVSRHPGASVADRTSALFEALKWSDDLTAPGDPSIVRLLHEPAAYTRVGMALVDFLATGVLDPGGEWRIEIIDDTGWGTTALPHVLELMNAVASVWGLDALMPRAVRCGTRELTRNKARYTERECETGTATASIRLEPFTPTWAPIERSAIPTVVVRSAYLPVDLAWLPQNQVGRRYVDPDGSEADDGLRRLLTAIFGFHEFREGQAQAIRMALEGRDACVLLPTGAGKSLIYQIAGLLHPGVTLVVDPLVSLVDDQERRLVADGIDRVVGLTSTRLNSSELRTLAYGAVAGGDALVVFLTPERLQIQAFRDALGAAADTRRVNLCVIDEAHCVSEWGHDFRTAYLRVGRNLRHLSIGNDDVPPPLLALTGTASPAVLRDVLIELQAPGTEMTVMRPTSFDRANLSYEVLVGDPGTWRSRVREALLEVLPQTLGCAPADLFALDGSRTRSGLVFVPHVNGEFGLDKTRVQVLQAIRSLDHDDLQYGVGTYAGKAPKDWTRGRAKWDEEKVRQADLFKDNQASVLVSTKAFGMGIDKPNIRWTLHVGHPSSIEGFAQEAGRAGRDGQRAHCVLVAVPPPPEVATALLDLSAPRSQRVEAYGALSRDQGGDLGRQYFFLTNNYDGVDQEFRPALDVLDQLLPAGATNRIAIPMSAATNTSGADKVEKALFRLAMVGVVDDYTIDYGGSRYVVDLADFSLDYVDTRLINFVERVEPSRARQRKQQIARAPENLRDRIAHHLRLLLDILYAVIEPARVRALAEMHLFATSGDDSEGLRQRVLAYLSDGPMAGILSELATADSISVRDATRVLDTVPAKEPREWIGSAARLLESYPDHPALLVVRGIGEALLPDPDEDVVATSLLSAFEALASYDVSADDAAWMFRWTCAQLRNQQDGQGWRLVPLAYEAFLRAGLGEGTVIEMEDVVFSQSEPGAMHPVELRYVLSRRLSRLRTTLDHDMHKLTGVRS